MTTQVQHDIDWKLVDWGRSADADLPWHRDDMVITRTAASAEQKGPEPEESRAAAAAESSARKGVSALPWLKGAKIDWSEDGRKNAWNISKRLLSYSHYANQFDDVNTVIQMMLTEARSATHADGGTLYLVTPDEKALSIAFFQNDTLDKDGAESRNLYVRAEIPIDERSIAGFVALTKKVLSIDNVGELPKDVPYTFNRKFDESSGYMTVSMLTVPVLATGGKVLAVLQLINSLDESGAVKPFDDTEALYAELLAHQSTPYLMKSMMTRRMIETMLHISEMRDPLETGAHVVRVGSIAAEIYEQWARDHDIDREEMMMEKDTLRLAAMLHDIGKLLIPDAIIKKPGKLTDEEYETMKTHCARGAEMYAKAETPLEAVAHDITLHHHQRWDGKGYTGDPKIPARSGAAIPLFARITSVADVVDALACSRSYKEAWKFDDVLAEIERSAGSQFDPEVVSAALKISDTMQAIIEKYN